MGINSKNSWKRLADEQKRLADQDCVSGTSGAYRER